MWQSVVVGLASCAEKPFRQHNKDASGSAVQLLNVNVLGVISDKYPSFQLFLSKNVKRKNITGPMISKMMDRLIVIAFSFFIAKVIL